MLQKIVNKLLPGLLSGRRTFLAGFLVAALCTGACSDHSELNNDLMPQSSLDFDLREGDLHASPMVGFVEFNERIQINSAIPEGRCDFASYEFRFEYNASVHVEFREGLDGNCSFGAILVKSFDVKVLAEEEFAMGKTFDPFVQFHQRNAHSGVFQIGTAYFNERVSDLRAVEVLCRGESCNGSVIRRQLESTSPSVAKQTG